MILISIFRQIYALFCIKKNMKMFILTSYCTQRFDTQGYYFLSLFVFVDKKPVSMYVWCYSLICKFNNRQQILSFNLDLTIHICMRNFPGVKQMNVKTGLTKYRSDKYKANKSQQQTLLKVQLIIVQLEYPGFLIDFQ